MDALRAKLAAQRRAQLMEEARPTAFDPQVQARIVSFTSGSHAYLTDGYRAKVVSHLVGAVELPDDTATAEANIIDRDALQVGDYLLFQRGSDADAIRVEADRLLADPAVRGRARLWHGALRAAQHTHQLDDIAFVQWLRDEGIRRQPSTILSWLRDEDLIAPRSYEDVERIARIAGVQSLQRELSGCKSAIREVRGAHLRASNHLAFQVIQAFAALTHRERSWESVQVAIGDSAFVLQLADIDSSSIPVRRSLCNRVIEALPNDSDVA